VGYTILKGTICLADVSLGCPFRSDEIECLVDDDDLRSEKDATVNRPSRTSGILLEPQELPFNQTRRLSECDSVTTPDKLWVEVGDHDVLYNDVGGTDYSQPFAE
jgi:hypothetical protein